MLNIVLVIVCHCSEVTDRHILSEAALGAADPDELGERCGAGARCGGCLPLIEEILEVRTLDGASAPAA